MAAVVDYSHDEVQDHPHDVQEKHTNRVIDVIVVHLKGGPFPTKRQKELSDVQTAYTAYLRAQGKQDPSCILLCSDFNEDHIDLPQNPPFPHLTSLCSFDHVLDNIFTNARHGARPCMFIPMQTHKASDHPCLIASINL